MAVWLSEALVGLEIDPGRAALRSPPRPDWRRQHGKEGGHRRTAAQPPPPTQMSSAPVRRERVSRSLSVHGASSTFHTTTMPAHLAIAIAMPAFEAAQQSGQQRLTDLRARELLLLQHQGAEASLG